MKPNRTDRLVEALFERSRRELPESVAHQACRCLLDYLGATLAGAALLETKGLGLLQSLGGSSGEAAVIGFKTRASVRDAALMNGISAHVAELDDGMRFGLIHPGAPLLSALLPLAEREQLSGKQLLAGMVAGYEAAVRIAMAIQPSHRKRGYFVTGTCGTIGAAVGAAAALGYTKAQTKDALSSAATSAAGLLETIRDGSDLKPFTAGSAASNGLAAAFVAGAGFAGPDDVLCGEGGFVTILSDGDHLEALEQGVGDAYCIEKVYFKPYAACRHCHPPIEAALKIRSRPGFRTEGVEVITVHTYEGAVGLNSHSRVTGVTSAKMSIPYSVAVALETGRAGLEAYLPDGLKDAGRAALAAKVGVRADPTLSALAPQRRSAIVDVRMKSGEMFTERVDIPKGEPENSLSDRELVVKFMELSAHANMTRERAQSVVNAVWEIEGGTNRLFRLLRETQ